LDEPGGSVLLSSGVEPDPTSQDHALNDSSDRVVVEKFCCVNPANEVEPRSSTGADDQLGLPSVVVRSTAAQSQPPAKIEPPASSAHSYLGSQSSATNLSDVAVDASKLLLCRQDHETVRDTVTSRPAFVWSAHKHTRRSITCR
jgi:hypothetical protein